jgi:hypothetical protein
MRSLSGKKIKPLFTEFEKTKADGCQPTYVRLPPFKTETMNKKILNLYRRSTVWWVCHLRTLTAKGYTNLIGESSANLDLKNQ